MTPSNPQPLWQLSWSADGRIAEATLLGVRILPAEADATTRETIIRALGAVHSRMSVPELSAHLRAAVPVGVQIVSHSILELAIALSDSLAAAPSMVEAWSPREYLDTRWRDQPWRIIPEEPLAAAVNLALDDTFTDAIAAGAGPVLRFWQWADPAIILGRSQSAHAEIQLENAAKHGIEWYRRSTGGGAMFVEPAGAITYSIVVPQEWLGGLTIRQSYHAADSWVIDALQQLGIDVHYVPVNDLACGQGKIGGAAQARRRGVIVHHTTLAYQMNTTLLAELLTFGQGAGGRGVRSASKTVSPLSVQTDLARRTIVEALLAAFQARFPARIEPLSFAERAAAQSLAIEKYQSAAWRASVT